MHELQPFADLLTQLRAGDEDAARQIYDAYSERLIAMARLRMGPRLARRIGAEDIVQSTYRSLFLRLTRGEYALESRDDLWRLLARMLRNKVCRQAKYHAANRRDMRRELTTGAEHEALVNDTVVCQSPTASLTASLLEQVERLLDRLKPRDRPIVTLRLLGHTSREIAERTGRAERSVRRVLERLMQDLTDRTLVID